MISQSMLVSGIQLNEDDFASKLIRTPARSGLEAESSARSFQKIMENTVSGESAGGYIGNTVVDRNDKRLVDACIEMESLFVARMLKEMRNTIHKTGWINGGFAESIFTDMLYDEYALSLSKNSNLGLAKMLYNELKLRV